MALLRSVEDARLGMVRDRPFPMTMQDSPRALISSPGWRREISDQVEAGLLTLRWLMNVQTAPAGFFRPVGSDTFGTHRVSPAAFDQQPLEAAAAISACLAAWRADSAAEWRTDAARASPGSLAAMICLCRLWTSRREAVAMGSIGIVRTRTVAVSLLSPICW